MVECPNRAADGSEHVWMFNLLNVWAFKCLNVWMNRAADGSEHHHLQDAYQFHGDLYLRQLSDLSAECVWQRYVCMLLWLRHSTEKYNIGNWIQERKNGHLSLETYNTYGNFLTSALNAFGSGRYAIETKVILKPPYIWVQNMLHELYMKVFWRVYRCLSTIGLCLSPIVRSAVVVGDGGDSRTRWRHRRVHPRAGTGVITYIYTLDIESILNMNICV